MSLEAMLTARAMDEGNALRNANLRHRRLLDAPLQIVTWQYGVEPFTIGALGYGVPTGQYTLCVPGFPLNRDLLFAALQPFADDLNMYFELPYEDRVQTSTRKDGTPIERSTSIAQLVVPNTATIALLGRLGRRLAYLPTDGEHPADPALVRLGRHLVFVARRAQFAGQQQIVAASDLLRSHWQTGMSGYEAASLAALQAWIDPPNGVHGFDAAANAENVPVGPQPDHGEGEKADRLVTAFNRARAGSVDPNIVEPLLGDLRSHYDHLVAATWSLTRECIDGERRWTEAVSVQRRFEVDCAEYTRHMEWMNGPAEGRRRARMTVRQAAMELHALEEAAARTTAEEAVDDALRMIPYLLAGKALEGVVVRVDPDHRELVGAKRRRRPIVVVSSDEPCLMPQGKHLYWIGEPAGREYVIEEVVIGPGSGSTVTLKLSTDRSAGLPAASQRTCFSELRTGEGYKGYLPADAPWTHRPKLEPEVTDLEASDDLASAA